MLNNDYENISNWENWHNMNDYMKIVNLYLWIKGMLDVAKMCEKNIKASDKPEKAYTAGYFTGSRETLEMIVGELEDHIRESEKRPRL